MIGSWDTIERHTADPEEVAPILEELGGLDIPYPAEVENDAQRELNEFIHILEGEGVTVRRPQPLHYDRPFASPDWSIKCGFCSANPRDPFLVVGDQIIETPMADRTRYFEAHAYRPIFHDYLRAGARWCAAPKPMLRDDLYNPDHELPQVDEPMSYVLTEAEPVFDAADFVRCGRDLFVQRSHVTNELGILWLERHLGEEYRIHRVETRNPYALHIDTTFMPLAPGKLLVNPEYLDLKRLPEAVRGWDLLVAPDPLPNRDPFKLVSKWIAMNVLMLDQERVVVERSQEPMIRALRSWGFKPVPCSFEHYYPYMGGFHCATLDIRRRGTLESYC